MILPVLVEIFLQSFGLALQNRINISLRKIKKVDVNQLHTHENKYQNFPSFDFRYTFKK